MTKNYWDLYKTRLNQNQGKIIPQRIREAADMVQLNGWYNDPQVIVDAVLYKHSETGHGSKYDIIATEDVKFIRKEEQAFASQAVEFFVQFKPGVEYDLGTYIDIPNHTGKLQRWLIVDKSEELQFIRFNILRCNYTVKWVKDNYIWECLSVVRNINSYSTGIYRGETILTTNNMTKLIMPSDYVSNSLYYDMRVVVSSDDREIPFVWKTSKVEELTPSGISSFTLIQDVYNEHTDYSEEHGIVAGVNNEVIYEEPVGNDIRRGTIDLYVLKRIGGGKEYVKVDDSVVKVGQRIKLIATFYNYQNEPVDVAASWKIEGLEVYKQDSRGNILEDASGNPIVIGQSYSELSFDDNNRELSMKINKDYYIGGTRFVVTLQDSFGDYEPVQMDLEVEA